MAERYTVLFRLPRALYAPGWPVIVRGGGEANLLEIAGEDGIYRPAAAEVRGDRLVLHAEGTENPVCARYAWTDYSDRVNLFGENGLPLEPFELA